MTMIEELVERANLVMEKGDRAEMMLTMHRLRKELDLIRAAYIEAFETDAAALIGAVNGLGALIETTGLLASIASLSRWEERKVKMWETAS